jgi:translation initiation factor IF-1
MSSNDSEKFLEFEGEVLSMIKDKALVKVNENYQVLCTLSGKIRQSGIKIMPCDRVKILVSPYYVELGRIVYRLKE